MVKAATIYAAALACSYGMVTSRPQKRPRSSIELDQVASGPSRQRADLVQLWQDGYHVADLDDGTNASRPSAATCLTGASRFSLHDTPQQLGQALRNRQSVCDWHMQKTHFGYRKNLRGHRSCVNALALSRGQGRWLASGGDDKEVHLRDLFVDLRNDNMNIPIAILKGHESNIFSLDWSADNKYLYSTGNDSQVLYYDVDHSQLPIRGSVPLAPQKRSPLNANAIGGHDDSIPELSAHPTNPNLLLSCDDSGNVKLLDIRTPHDAVAAARCDVAAGFSSVQWNPNVSDGNTFGAATCGLLTGSTRLYDVRQCFASDSSRPLTSRDAVLNYHTVLMQNSASRGLIGAIAETNSICFDPQGRFLASSISRYHPTIYAIDDPDPLVTLESTVAEDVVADRYRQWSEVPKGTRTAPKKLSSCCTIKHGSFGFQTQTGKLHYAIGSDDFRAYVFEIPDRDILERQREFINRPDWIQTTTGLHIERGQRTVKTGMTKPSGLSAKVAAQEGNDAEDESDREEDSDSDTVSEGQVDHESEIVYSAGSLLRGTKIVRPARIQQQAHVLCGGRSIVNTALIHPTLPFVLTAGIVSDVTVHSATLLSSRDLYVRNGHGPDADAALKTGGTRPRWLIAPSAQSLIDDEGGWETDSESDDDDDVDDEDDDDDDDVGEAIQRGRNDANLDADSNQHQTAGTVHEFLAEMRNDPLYSTPGTLDYHLDRHVGTYSLAHLSRGSASEASSLASEVLSPLSSLASSGFEHESVDTGIGAGGNVERHSTDNADNDTLRDSIYPVRQAGDSEQRRPMQGTDAYASDSENDDDIDELDGDDRRDREGDIGENEAMDEAVDYDPNENDGYEPSLADWSEPDERNEDEDPLRYSNNGRIWAMARAMERLRREQKRIRLFDQLLRRDELRSLTAEFNKIPRFAGGQGDGLGFQCGSCRGNVDTDQ